MINNCILASVKQKKEIMYKLFFIFLSIIIITSFSPAVVFAYKTGVHKRITYEAINQNKVFFNQVLNKIGFTNGVDQIIKGFKEKPIYEWLQYGSEWEDNIGIYWINPLSDKGAMYNHFFNPLYNLGYYEIEDGQKNVIGESLIDRMNDSVPDSLGWQKNHNEWAYQMARKLYYAALTGNSHDAYDYWFMRDKALNMFTGKENMNQSERDQFFAWTFQALGHIMHLIQDASVPAHTRNDPHAIKLLEYFKKGFIEPYEEWTNENLTDNDLMNYTGFGSEPWLSWKSYYDNGGDINIPIQNIFIDYSPFPANPSPPDTIIPSETFDQGLAEYSFANFLSEDSKASYNLPDKHGYVFQEVHEKDGKQHTFVYRESSNIAQGGVKHLMLHGIIKHIVAPNTISPHSYYKTAYTLDDEEVNKDYASKIIPRAVGYSAGFLEYFFRGSIELSIPDDGFYALTDNISDPSKNGFKLIKLKARNVTPNDEKMEDGTIELVVKYRLSETDPFSNNTTEIPSEFHYIMVPVQDENIIGIPRNDTVELSFDLTGNEIPLWATDVYLQVVYRGKLGNETDGIAVGFKDISEPTPIDLFNNMDKICFNGVWENSGDPALIAYVDNPANGGNEDGQADEYDVYSHDLKDVYYRYFPVDSPILIPSSADGEHQFHIPGLSAGESIRSHYILADYGEYNYTMRTSYIVADNDPWAHYDTMSYVIYDAVKNQAEWNGIDGYDRIKTPYYYVFRGVSIMGGIITINYPYPDPTDLNACPLSAAE